jgi:hypothetical protein
VKTRRKREEKTRRKKERKREREREREREKLTRIDRMPNSNDSNSPQRRRCIHCTTNFRFVESADI